MSSPCYISPEIDATRDLFDDVNKGSFRILPIREQISHLAGVLYKSHCAADLRVLPILRAAWPKALGCADETLMTCAFRPDDARLTVARNFGYSDWADAKSRGEGRVAMVFEAAVDAIVTGDVASLRATLLLRPDLVRARSRYGHRATLLHYLAAHGVESHRQTLPLNAAEVGTFLIEKGANPRARLEGLDASTPYDLAVSSPAVVRAGLSEDIAAILWPAGRVTPKRVHNTS